MNAEKSTAAVPASAWFKSSYSTGSGGECIEVAVRPHLVHVRDSKDLSRRGVAIDAAAWTAFVGFAVGQGSPGESLSLPLAMCQGQTRVW
ncbi:hypothetical protein GCM10010344_56920 [Streptomyces bluensis]|nr:hypothetical protein GCM10010344_56920 [Streptomyces bluensis]